MRPEHRGTTRIGLVCEYPTLSGGERAGIDLMARLVGQGVAPVVLAPPGGNLEHEVRRRGVALHSFDLAPFKARGPGFKESAARALVELRNDLGLDLLHGNSLSIARTVGIASRLGGFPAISHVRDIRRLNRSWREQIEANEVLVAVSDAVRRSLLAGGVAPGRIALRADGVDAARFCPDGPTADLRAELHLNPDTYLIGCVGQLSVRKGQRLLLRALAAAVPRLPTFACVLVGERFSSLEANRLYERDLRRMAEAPPLGGRVFFSPFREDIDRVLRGCDVIAHPAHQEPLSCVLLEAGAVARPVVATRVGGSPEIVEDGVTGLLVERGDAGALAEALVTLARDPGLRARMGTRARERCKSCFDPDMAALGLAAIYRRVLLRRPRNLRNRGLSTYTGIEADGRPDRKSP